MIDLDLTGRTAIVTGPSQRIGPATVRLLADHAAPYINGRAMSVDGGSSGHI